MNEKEFKGIAENQDPVVYCLSHIARQLTRIADTMGDTVVAIVEPATPAPDANIRYEILAKAFFYDTKIMAPGKDIAAAENPPYTNEERQSAWRKWLKENDVPAPVATDARRGDALVEAVKRFISGARGVKDTEGINHDYIISVSAFNHLEKALAAHIQSDGRMTEKAGE